MTWSRRCVDRHPVQRQQEDHLNLSFKWVHAATRRTQGLTCSVGEERAQGRMCSSEISDVRPHPTLLVHMFATRCIHLVADLFAHFPPLLRP